MPSISKSLRSSEGQPLRSSGFQGKNSNPSMSALLEEVIGSRQVYCLPWRPPSAGAANPPHPRGPRAARRSRSRGDSPIARTRSNRSDSKPPSSTMSPTIRVAFAAFAAEGFQLRPRLLDHRRRMIDKCRRKSALQQLESPFARPASQIATVGAGVDRQIRLDCLPGQAIVKFPVRVVINRIIFPRDAIMIAA